jgi:hypothetical protein
MVETYGLLPPTRESRRTTQSRSYWTESIHRAWGVGLPVASVALLDVTRAYDNTAHERLLHHLRKKGLGRVIPWVRAFSSDRSTRICMPEGLAERVPTPTGIPQGSPLSPILYLFYNAGLIELGTEQGTRENAEAENLKRTVAYSWVDDVSCLAAGMSKQETVAKLQVACRRAQTGLQNTRLCLHRPSTSYSTSSIRRVPYNQD